MGTTITITLEEYKSLQAQSNLLKEINQLLSPRNSTLSTKTKVPMKFGGGKHLIEYISPDFDAPLENLQDYMP